MSVSPYPTPELGGPMWRKFRDLDPDYDPITTEQKMDDGGVDYNLEADTPILAWEFLYGPLLLIEMQAFLDHRAEAKGKTGSFTFTHPRKGITYTGVRYLTFEPDHDKQYTNSQSLKIVLVKYP